MSPALQRDDGFNLLEVMVVVLILAILLAIAIGSFAYTTARAREVVCVQNQQSLERAVEIYRGDTPGGSPQTIDDLAPYVKNFSRIVQCPSDRTVRLTYDAGTESVSCALHPK